MIDGVVDAEEAVVGVLELVNDDGLVLRIVALQVECKLLCDAASVNLCDHPRFELSQICNSCHALQFFSQSVVDVLPCAGTPTFHRVGCAGHGRHGGGAPAMCGRPLMSALNFWSFCFKTKGQENCSHRCPPGHLSTLA